MTSDQEQPSQGETSFGCIVIGAGMAGASVAAELSRRQKVLLLERESQPGYHTTGRSAAIYTVAYGPPVIRALTRASGAFFADPPGAHLTAPLLRQRGVVFPVREDQLAAMARMKTELGDAVSELNADDTWQAVPLLRPDYAAAGLFDPTASDIDVNALHQHYLRSFRSAGGVLQINAEVTGLQHGPDWRVETTGGVFTAPIIVNASGAWADQIARLADVAPKGLVPKMRTALTVAAPDQVPAEGWPMVVDVEEQFYLKPDAGRLLISPADEIPSPPCDAQPDEMQVAICVDRIERAFDLAVRRIDSKWAGLRSFFADGCPLAGYDPDRQGFFWLAGQGGYGIQTAPALARAAAALIDGRGLPSDISDQGISAADLGATRKGLVP